MKLTSLETSGKFGIWLKKLLQSDGNGPRKRGVDCSLGSAAFLDPCHHQEGPFPRMRLQDFILIDPEIEVSGHRDKTQG